MHKRINDILSLLMTLAAALIATACVDEIDVPRSDGRPPEGMPATMVLRWDTETQAHMSRAQMSDKDASTVNTLWVGVYDYNDGKPGGKLCYSQILTPGIDFTSGTGNSTADKQSRTLSIQSTSGRRRIVAVANVRANYGITDNRELCEALGMKAGEARLFRLSNMLELADTWEKFRSISACLTDSADVSPVTANLIMAGTYNPGGMSHPKGTPVSWLDLNENGYVDILPGNNKLDGTVHLRRLLSYVRFNIIPDPASATTDDGSVIKEMTIEPLSWQVHNVPMLSYLHEQAGNSSDNTHYFDFPDNYGTSARSYIFDEGKLERADRTPLYLQGQKEQAQGLWFDFYQFENKRTGLSSVNGYHDREKEFKNGNTNTGIYASLCPSVNETANNFGSFVTFSLKMDYTIVAKDGTTTNRVAYPTYTVHLGYCEGDSESEKARDFNTRRNARYTYNVRLAGVDKIKVEAESDTGAEPQPGAEGDVFDTENKVITLDAHYCVWNVQFSNHARTNIDYRVRAFYNNTEYNFSRDDIERIANGTYPGINQDFAAQLVNWVTIRPTSDENTVARFVPHGEKDGVWTLTEFADVKNHPNYNGSKNENDTKETWYTVFFNEYAYELGTDGKTITNPYTGGEGGWENWIDQPDRVLWLSINPYNVSADGESTYSRSRYIFSQQSIQSYYSEDNRTPNNTAMGMEHINECFGHNFRWTWTPKVTLNNENGRWNTWQYANGKEWSELIDDHLISNPEITEQFNYSSGPYPAQTFPVRRTFANKMSSTLATDPQPGNYEYHEMIDVCMNRNRDLNGNGKIDPEELRWYLPTTGKYLRLILGRNSMKVPLMDYNATSRLTYGTVWPANAKNTRFHYFSSNQETLWAEEGLSKGAITTGVYPGGNIRYPAWQARCVRNLGVNHSVILDTDPIQRAYTLNGNIIDMAYYDNASIRASVATTLPSHRVNERANMVARKLQYADNTINVTLSKGSQSANIADWKNRLDTDNPCGSYSQNGDDAGWRVPNQKELAIMRQAGLITENTNYLTCTQAFFDDRFMGANSTQSYALNMDNGTYRVWCVRDVIDGTRKDAPEKKRVTAKRPRGQKAQARAAKPAAPDFRFLTRENTTSSLAEMKGCPVLLMFYDPDCDHCRDAVAQLRNDPELAGLLRDGKAKVLAVDAEPDFEAWQRTSMHLPREWTVAFDRSGILDNALYKLDRMPALYVIGSDGTIVLEDTTPWQALLKIKNLANRQ